MDTGARETSREAPNAAMPVATEHETANPARIGFPPPASRLLPSLPPNLMRHLLPLLLLGCASRVPRIPGPLGPVARAAPPAHVLELPRIQRPDSPPPPAPESRTPRQPAPRPAPEPQPPSEPRRRDGFGDQLADAAEHYLHHTPRGFRNDCSGFVMAAYDRAGHPIVGNTRSLWATAKDDKRTHRKKRPDPGDLVFFDDTYDRNGNGKRDDELTHIGVVLAVDDDGTITVAHGGTSKGRTLLYMNLYTPDVRRDPEGAVRNDYLRARRRGESENEKFLAGELFRGFASPR